MSRNLIVLIVIGLVCPQLASAQPKEDARAAAAKAYFERGDAHFKAGRYLEARAEFSAGYELSRRPLFLFNMAECSRLNGDADIARETYERYLLAEPQGAQAGLAKQRLAALNAKTPPKQEPPKQDPPKQDPPKDPPKVVGPQKPEPAKAGPIAPAKSDPVPAHPNPTAGANPATGAAAGGATITPTFGSTNTGTPCEGS